LRYPPKVHGPEYFDGPVGDPIEFAGLLGALRRINRWYGGYGVVLRYLERFAHLLPNRPLVIADVATGSGDVPAAIAAWAHRRRLPVRIVALDLNPDILGEARKVTAGLSEIALMQADGLSLPFADRSVDLVISALTLHHFSFDDAAALLREINRVAGGGFLVNDIMRSWPAYLGALFDATIVERNRLAKHDTPVSVLRSYTWPQFHELARAADLPRVEIRGHGALRAVLVRWPEETHHGR
jgi:SAM-dependent methyltransferase